MLVVVGGLFLPFLSFLVSWMNWRRSINLRKVITLSHQLDPIVPRRPMADNRRSTNSIFVPNPELSLFWFIQQSTFRTKSTFRSRPSSGTSAGDETVNKQQSSGNFAKVSMNWIYCQPIYSNLGIWAGFWIFSRGACESEREAHSNITGWHWCLDLTWTRQAGAFIHDII